MLQFLLVLYLVIYLSIYQNNIYYFHTNTQNMQTPCKSIFFRRLFKLLAALQCLNYYDDLHLHQCC